jgi:hypothetical protein
VVLTCHKLSCTLSCTASCTALLVGDCHPFQGNRMYRTSTQSPFHGCYHSRAEAAQAPTRQSLPDSINLQLRCTASDYECSLQQQLHLSTATTWLPHAHIQWSCLQLGYTTELARCGAAMCWPSTSCLLVSAASYCCLASCCCRRCCILLAECQQI